MDDSTYQEYLDAVLPSYEELQASCSSTIVETDNVEKNEDEEDFDYLEGDDCYESDFKDASQCLVMDNKEDDSFEDFQYYTEPVEEYEGQDDGWDDIEDEFEEEFNHYLHIPDTDEFDDDGFILRKQPMRFIDELELVHSNKIVAFFRASLFGTTCLPQRRPGEKENNGMKS